MTSLATLSFILCQVAALLTVSTCVLVTSPSGSYLGTTSHTPAGRPYRQHLGVPYAEPPVGGLRFKPTVPKARLEGEYDAREAKPHCVQMDYIQPTEWGAGEEDCLYLNIYSPPFTKGGKLHKVLVFIHGGGNMNGFQDFYQPTSLVSHHNIVVVTLNYRLGVLGFLSTNSSAAAGNFGLWDQLTAVKWVKDNIRAFGGDPQAITVSGESAGAIDVTSLTLSPHSKGLFLRVFAMSGAIGAKHSLTVDNPEATAAIVARREGCLGEDDLPTTSQEWKPVVECLRGVPADRFADLTGLGLTPVLGPVVDWDLIPGEIHQLFADDDYLESIGFHERYYMASLVYGEGEIFRASLHQQEKFMSKEQKAANPPAGMWHGVIRQLLGLMYGPVSGEVVEKVAKFYESEYNPDSPGGMHPVNPLADFAGDAYFHYPVQDYLSAVSEAALHDNRVHLIHFVHFPEFLYGPYKGMPHAVDLVYLFDMEAAKINDIVDYKIDSAAWTSVDSTLRTNWRKLVADYVNTGTAVVQVGDSQLKWPAYDVMDGYFLEFSVAPAFSRYLKRDRMQIFRETIPHWMQQFPYTGDLGEAQSESLGQGDDQGIDDSPEQSQGNLHQSGIHATEEL